MCGGAAEWYVVLELLRTGITWKYLDDGSWGILTADSPPREPGEGSWARQRAAQEACEASPSCTSRRTSFQMVLICPSPFICQGAVPKREFFHFFPCFWVVTIAKTSGASHEAAAGKVALRVNKINACKSEAVWEKRRKRGGYRVRARSCASPCVP